MSSATLEAYHRPDRRVTPRAGRIDAKHAPGGRAPTFTLTWNAAACEAGAWRTIVGKRSVRIAPARGLDAGVVLRDVIEGLLRTERPPVREKVATRKGAADVS